MKVIDFVGYSGSGKTTLVEQLVTIFCNAGFDVAAIKSAHHEIQVDKPGKDSYRFQAAGAQQVIVKNDSGWAMMRRTPLKPATLKELVSKLDPCDLVLVEGFKKEDDADLRLEVWRAGVKEEPAIYTQDRGIQAVLTDVDSIAGCEIPVINLNNPRLIARFIADKLNLKSRF